MTWALFDVSDPVVGDIMLAYQGDKPGDVMQQIMRTRPNAVVQDFLSWLYARPGKAWLMVGGLYNPTTSTRSRISIYRSWTASPRMSESTISCTRCCR